MASISYNRKNKRREIQFRDTDGSRKTVRLGKVPKKEAELVKTQVELLLTAKSMSTPLRPQTCEWLRGIGPELHSRLSAVGLIEGRKSSILGDYIDDYIAKRSKSDAKPLTVKKWKTTRRRLTEFLGEKREMRTITAGDAKHFRLHLMAQRKDDGTQLYRQSTIGKHIEIAKLFFGAAEEDEVVERNVFRSVVSTKTTDASREYFVTRAEVDKCIDAAPNWQWRTIIALCRYGGLRCPSELVPLKWEHILWGEDRLLVHSPKTEHHEGRDKRLVPLYPKLREQLDEALRLAEEGSEYVIPLCRDPKQNLRTAFSRIIDRAGLKQWPKLFQNLRASRQTELEEEFPTHVVCGWMGNSPKVARKHYLQTTDEHFRKATQKATQCSSVFQPFGLAR